MMNTSAEAEAIYPTTAKKMPIMLILAFLGSQLSLAGGLILGVIYALSGGFGSLNLMAAAILVLLAFGLISASFLLLSLYPERGQRQVFAGFLAAVIWTAGMAASYSTELFSQLGLDPYNDVFHSHIREAIIAITILVCLLMSGRIKNWLSLLELIVGLLVGVAIHQSDLYGPTSLDYAPLWLSAVVFPALFSRRTSWDKVLIGLLISGVLAGVAMLLMHVIVVLFGGGR